MVILFSFSKRGENVGAKEVFLNTLEKWYAEGLSAAPGKMPEIIVAAYHGRTSPSGADYNYPGAWCAATMVAASFYAGARKNSIVPITMRCRQMRLEAMKQGTWRDRADIFAGNYIPVRGDIFVLLDGSSNKKNEYIFPAGTDNPSGHVGAILSFNLASNNMVTLDGNYSNKMHRGNTKIDKDGRVLAGVIHPDWESANQPPVEYVPGTKKTTTTIKADPISRTNNAMFGDLAVTCSGTQLAMSGYIVDSLKTDYVYTADLYLADIKGRDLQYIGYKQCNEFLDGLQAYGGGKHKFELVWDYNALSKYGNGNYNIKMYGRNPNNGSKKLIIQKKINITCKLGQAVQPSTSDEGEYYPIYLGNSISIWDALESLGIDGTYAHRKLIAVANNIEGYTGTASQNTYILSLLKEGKLRKE